MPFKFQIDSTNFSLIPQTGLTQITGMSTNITGTYKNLKQVFWPMGFQQIKSLQFDVPEASTTRSAPVPVAMNALIYV